MEKFKIDYKTSNLFSDLFNDHADGKSMLKNLVVDFPSVGNIKKSLSQFKFDYLNRKVLADELLKQSDAIKISDATKNNISSLSKDNSFTVTTGHQLCLFTGPSFFVYKIISCIKTCELLNREIPGKHFVPVYWLASEDHDLEEIDHAFFYKKKLKWYIESEGLLRQGTSVTDGRAGELTLGGIEKAIEELKEILGESENAKKVISLFESAYLNRKNLAEAMRFLVNELFGKYGLVIVDGNTKTLKNLFRSEIKNEILYGKSFEKVNEQSDWLESNDYGVQVTPREVNLFYARENSRQRIVKNGDKYEVLNTDIVFTEEEILQEIENNVTAFSPNVVLRPLYQQKILPNIIYCGGPGEIAYWLQYKGFFDATEIHFPFLMPRNFVCLVEKNAFEKWKALGFTAEDFFADGEELIKNFVKKQSGEISLSSKKEKLSAFYAELETEASQTDKSLSTFIAAEKQKAINSLDTLESKLNRALKQKNENGVNQILSIHSKVFPDGTFQERQENFFAFVNKHGFELFEKVFEALESPLGKKEVLVLVV